jgi:hypothetical protein
MAPRRRGLQLVESYASERQPLGNRGAGVHRDRLPQGSSEAGAGWEPCESKCRRQPEGRDERERTSQHSGAKRISGSLLITPIGIWKTSPRIANPHHQEGPASSLRSGCPPWAKPSSSPSNHCAIARVFFASLRLPSRGQTFVFPFEPLRYRAGFVRSGTAPATSPARRVRRPRPYHLERRGWRRSRGWRYSVILKNIGVNYRCVVSKESGRLSEPEAPPTVLERCGRAWWSMPRTPRAGDAHAP